MASFYFYDLETTGFNPREGRIMQFAGQRTTLELEPVGKADNFYIKITPDILPDPGAVLVTGITPQKTLKDGLSEFEFLRYFWHQISRPNTIFVGYNNIRFDDEFMRHLFYRNFYDPYEWQWKDGCSRWDLLDVTRLTRALRPQGIKWPVDSSGVPSNQLGLLTSINKLEHANAHDALSDVNATISLARLINQKQPKLFNYLLKLRDKQKIETLVNQDLPFIYASGKYPSEFEKTTVAKTIVKHPTRQGVIVYDLRYDPTPFANLNANELAQAWKRRDAAEGLILPAKTLQYNRCPAVAPLSVLDKSSQTRLKLDLRIIDKNAESLVMLKDLPAKLVEAQAILDKKQSQLITDFNDPDNQLYDKFFDSQDKQAMGVVRAAEPEELSDLSESLKDNRLKALLPLYKARNFAKYLTPKEATAWLNYRSERLLNGRLEQYFNFLEELSGQLGIKQEQKHIIEELKAYGESITPASQ